MEKTKIFGSFFAMVFMFVFVCLFVGCGATESEIAINMKAQGYTKQASIETLNNNLLKSFSNWKITNSTVNGKEITTYEFLRGGAVVYHKQEENPYFEVHSFYGETFKVFKNNENYLATFEDGFLTVEIKKDNSRKYSNVQGENINTTFLNVESSNEGFLFATENNFLIFFDSNFLKFWVCEYGQNCFTFQNETKSLRETRFLNTRLSAILEDEKLNLLAPDNFSGEVFMKQNTQNVEIVLSETKPSEYVHKLNDAGFKLFLNEDWRIVDYSNKENACVWKGTTKYGDFKLTINYLSNLGALKSKNNFGTQILISPVDFEIKTNFSTLAKKLDWSDEEKDEMIRVFGEILPFTALGENYELDLNLTINQENPNFTTINTACQHYTLKDFYFKDFMFKDYGEVLVQNGFTKYVPPVTLRSDENQVFAWKNSEESKFFNTYYNDNLVIKIFYDTEDGSVLNIYKKSAFRAYV